MKKLVCLLLCAVLLCACGAPAVQNPEAPAAPQYDYDYLVGFGRRDITPKESVPLAGYGFTSNRMSQYVLDELYTTAVAITDRWGESMILVSTDLINANTTVVNSAKQKIFDAIGLPEANIMFCHTHTHSAPDQSNTSATEYMKTYLQEAADGIAKAAIAAWENREKATMYTSAAMTEGLNLARSERKTVQEQLGGRTVGIRPYTDRIASVPLHVPVRQEMNHRLFCPHRLILVKGVLPLKEQIDRA